MMNRTGQFLASRPPTSSTTLRSSFWLVLTATCSGRTSGWRSRYSRTSSACTNPALRCSRPVRSTCIRQIGRMCSPVSASWRSAFFSRSLRCSTDANSVSCQLTLALFLMCRSSLTISSAASSRPDMFTSTLAPLGGVADSSTIMYGLKPSSVFLALRLYALCPSSRTISGRSSRNVLPKEVLTWRSQTPPCSSKVSRFGRFSNSFLWPSASSSGGKKRSKPPLSRNMRSCSFVRRLAEGSISRRTHSFSATSRGAKPLVFSRTSVRPADSTSSCWR